ncbi:MAG TPA: maltose alpha-D-glucosyltransferase [Terriglobales bacterium]|nr:maltose alpha-D-glucosyltransferase [Terriglobales bacterium]
MPREKHVNPNSLPENPLWYKDAVIYEVHVRAFADGNSDGIGDFKGLTEKLDYLYDLGVTAIWLLPFYPSPLRDDGYDIASYTEIHPDYGTLKDFRLFLREAHRRGLRVITELVLNHTSDQHPWFQRARRAAPGSKERDFYVWSDTQEKYVDARIIFKDFETSNWAWDPVAKAYYWHRFYSHQPDLNFANPTLKKAFFNVVDFWLDLGVDGLRLDAVPYLFEREGTNCENLPETHQFLKELRRHIDEQYRDRMLLAEANQWPEEAVSYFGNGDECHMAFHFPVMPRIFMAVHMEDRFPIVDILDQTPVIPENCQWTLFLRNHDELTLEMVTDEDRDYMYKVYANDPKARLNLGIRRRLAPLLGNNRRKLELLNALLFSLPGTPVIYYGDEIGMGDNIYLGDRNGVRTPMQWSADRNAGFSESNPQRLYLPIIIDPENHYEAVNVEAQQQNLSSILWWTKRLILLRKRFRAFSRGNTQFLYPKNRRMLAFVRQLDDEIILTVANLSRFVQCAELDLSAFRGKVPVELFGQTEFPPIGDLPYFITLGPHGFYWFKLDPPQVPARLADDGQAPIIEVAGAWDQAIHGSAKAMLEKLLPRFLQNRRWFSGKARKVRAARIVEAVPVVFDSTHAYFAAIEINYGEGDPETYLLPLTFASGERVTEILQANPEAILAQLKIKRGGETADGVLYDGVFDRGFRDALLDGIARRRSFHGQTGAIVMAPTKNFRKLRGPMNDLLEPTLAKKEQSNTSITYGNRLILKIFRRLHEGVNPDLEISRFITEKTDYPHTPALAGSIEFHKEANGTATVGVLQSWVRNEGDAWSYTLDILGDYLEHCLTRSDKVVPPGHAPGHLLDHLKQEVPALALEAIGPYLGSADLLGRRTGELHLALASDRSDPDFAPEPFTSFYRRSLYQSLRTGADRALMLLRDRVATLPDDARSGATRLLSLKSQIIEHYRSVLDRKFTAVRIRCHGDYHLGQLLFTGKDFVVIDFEGEPARPLVERRAKRSPIVDIAGMLRSFDYAAIVASRTGEYRAEDRSYLETWSKFWVYWVSRAFLDGYFTAATNGGFLPTSREELKLLLDLYTLQKAMYELTYELNNRPDWVHVPIQGILGILQPTA